YHFSSLVSTSLFSLSASAPPRALHSFPTRRSSDLALASGRIRNLNECGFRQRPDLHSIEPHGVVPSHRFHQFVEDGRDGKNFLLDRKSTRLNSSHVSISYAVFCLKKKKKKNRKMKQ